MVSGQRLACLAAQGAQIMCPHASCTAQPAEGGGVSRQTAHSHAPGRKRRGSTETLVSARQRGQGLREEEDVDEEEGRGADEEEDEGERRGARRRCDSERDLRIRHPSNPPRSA